MQANQTVPGKDQKVIVIAWSSLLKKHHFRYTSRLHFWWWRRTENDGRVQRFGSVCCFASRMNGRWWAVNEVVWNATVMTEWSKNEIFFLFKNDYIRENAHRKISELYANIFVRILSKMCLSACVYIQIFVLSGTQCTQFRLYLYLICFFLWKLGPIWWKLQPLSSSSSLAVFPLK